MGGRFQRSQEFRRCLEPAELTQRRAGGDWALLRQYQCATADRTKSATTGRGSASDPRYRRLVAFLRAGVRRPSRCLRRMLGVEILLQLLAPDHRDPEREYRRKRCDTARCTLAPADRDAGTSRVA